MPVKNFRITLLIILSIFLFITYTVFLFLSPKKQFDLPVLGQVFDFHLYDEEGKPFSLSELQGDIWIANFFFTTCADICPVMSRNMAALHRSFDLVDDVTQVSITVNPEFDSSGVLMKYAEKFKANTSKWHFLTGTRAQITELAVKSFKLGSIEEPVFHSPKFALVDRKGWIRGYYDGVQSGEVSQLFSDIASLLKEK
jgi:protein SCO1/2